MFRAFTRRRIDSALKVNCCASSRIYVSSQGHHILASAKAAIKVLRLESRVNLVKATNH